MELRFKSIAMTLLLPIFASFAYPGIVEIPEETLIDKIRDGLLGQILGNLNGLEHEFKYIDEPGDVRDYVPSLPDGGSRKSGRTCGNEWHRR